MNEQHEHARETTPEQARALTPAGPALATRPRHLHFRRRRVLWVLGLEYDARDTTNNNN